MTQSMIDMAASPGFAAWLDRQAVSVVFTSYRAGKLITLGAGPGGALTASDCSLRRCMGLGIGANRFWTSSEHQIWRFDNFVPTGERHGAHDAYFVPTVAHTTGSLDVHDIAEDASGSPIFATPRFNCLARLAEAHSFEPVWMPRFIDTLIAEDRCHLNGFAMQDGKPRYVTCIATTNTSGAWRDHRRDAGVVLDTESGEALCESLSMPHSPRLRDGKLWLHQSGSGLFGSIDPSNGRFETLCKLPGFGRGLAFHGKWALVGVSLPRGESGFGDLPLSERLSEEGRDPECALYLIDLESGEVEHTVQIGPDVHEIHDVGFLPGIRNPHIVAPDSEEIRFAIRPKV
jgi:uncharacterized protein (TIGR03032 family)